MKRYLLGLIFLLWLLPSLACNFPGRQRITSLTGEQLRQTLEAQAVATLPGQNQPTARIVELTALPGSPQTAPQGFFSYFAQSGDALPALARRFHISSEEIASPQLIPVEGYITPGQQIWIPYLNEEFSDTNVLLPDSEVLYSPTSLDFDTSEYIHQTGGFLSTYFEPVNGQTLSGAEIVERVSRESSINPRLLLAFLEFRSGWVFAGDDTQVDPTHPLGFNVTGYIGLYHEMVMAATQLNTGFYGWRSGDLLSFKFSDGSEAQINPRLNAGTVAIQNLFAKFYSQADWTESLYGENNFLALYQQRFGDPWIRAARVEPLITPQLVQPFLELPFTPGERWSFTGGPHFSWNHGSARGAIDFAPTVGEEACAVSSAWVLSAAPGMIVRSANNVVALDLDGDGNEATGWVLIYLHIADLERIPVGQVVIADTRIGHPSCERGQSTGTNVHLARKYNGEWIPADGPIPFVLGGWEAQEGERNYLGSLVNGDKKVFASPVGARTSLIVR